MSLSKKYLNGLIDLFACSEDEDALFLDLLKKELKFLSCLPLPNKKDKGCPYILKAYFLVMSYMGEAKYDVSSSYLKEVITQVAKQLSEDKEGVQKVVASKSLNSDSVSISLLTKDGATVSELDIILKQLDKFKVTVPVYEDRSMYRV